MSGVPAVQVPCVLNAPNSEISPLVSQINQNFRYLSNILSGTAIQVAQGVSGTTYMGLAAGVFNSTITFFAGGAFSVTLTHSATVNRTITFQNRSGTVALLGDASTADVMMPTRGVAAYEVQREVYNAQLMAWML